MERTLSRAISDPHSRIITNSPRTGSISIRLSFRKEQNPRRETIDAMYDKGSLSLQCKFFGKQRQSGRGIGAFNRHSRKSGRFIEDHHGIVFVKHGKLT